MRWSFEDAGSGMRRLKPGVISALVTSPPYFQCRNYDEGAEDRNGIGENVGPAETGLGREDRPETYAANLAAKFGAGEWLADGGSAWVIIGDSFARRDFDAPDGASIRKGEAIGVHHMFVREMRKLGWMLWQEIVWLKPSVAPSGTVKVRCNPCHEYVLWFARGRPRWNSKAVREIGKTPAGKAMPPVGGKKYGSYRRAIVSDGKRCRQDVWTICPSRDSSAHVAPFPEEIPRLIIEACTRPGDVVCDPFAGTGTTGRAADAAGRLSIMFDVRDWRGVKRKRE